MTQGRAPRVRCYSLRHGGGVADVCHALTVFIAIKSNTIVRAAFHELTLDPDKVAQLGTERQTWALSGVEELIAKDWRLADAKLSLIEFCQRAVFRAHAQTSSGAGPAPTDHEPPVAAAACEFHEFGRVRASARRERDKLAYVLARVRAVTRREYVRPFLSAIANDNQDTTTAAGGGD